jgi:hypothetical protein
MHIHVVNLVYSDSRSVRDQNEKWIATTILTSEHGAAQANKT